MYRDQIGRVSSPFEREISQFVFLGVPTSSSHCAPASNFRQKVRHQTGAGPDLRSWSACCSALRAGFRQKSAVHFEKLLL